MPRPRYGTVTQLLHWGTATLVLVAFLYGPGGSEQRVYSQAVDFDRQLQETLGICVLALVLFRLLWRWFEPTPDAPPMPRWMKRASTLFHVLLYSLLIAVPVTAIAGAWLEGHALTFLGDVRLPPPVATAHDLGQSIASIHTWLGDTLLWIAGFHAAAGLYHHFILKDGVLRSMLPKCLLADSGSS